MTKNTFDNGSTLDHVPSENVSSEVIETPKDKEGEVIAIEQGFDKKGTQRLLRKLDWHLIPFLSLLYLLSFLDRSNVGNARVAGMEDALGLVGLQYNAALATFFPFYVLTEIPSNLMMKLTRPSIWIPSIMVAWGICCTLMGLVENYGGLLVARAALGLAEGGLFPGVTYYITLWYRRHECGLRMAVFFSAATAAGAFGGLLARGLVEMDGLGGLDGWSWIFIIEGLATFICAVAAFWTMYDYPDTAKFLTEEEKQEVHRRLDADRSSLDDSFHWQYFWHAIGDWKIWVMSLITICIFTPLYSFSLFLPTIVEGLDYDGNQAQLMSVPPYLVACVFCIGGGFAADRHGQRGIYIVGFAGLAIIGFIMQVATQANHVKYAGTFLAACGIYPNVPQVVAWNGNNIGGSVKRGVGIAMQVGIGNLGGIIAAFIYRKTDAPKYYAGHGPIIAINFIALVLSIVMTLYLRWENKRRDKTYEKHPWNYTHEEKVAEMEKGDHASFFRYTV